MISTYFDKAMADVQAKGLDQIQYETAWTWAARACAASTLGLSSDAREYAHEGLEHAALSGRPGLVEEVRAALLDYGVVV